MADQGVALDFSKAQPIAPPASSNVALDFSKAQPVQQDSPDDHWFHGFGNTSQADIDRMKAENGPMKQLGQAAIGSVKGAGETVSTVAQGLNHIPGVGEF